MCMQIMSEKGARSWLNENLYNAETVFERYPNGDRRQLESYRDRILRDIRRDVQYWQRAEGWLLDIDLDTLKPKAKRPVVNTQRGVDEIERGLTVRALADA